METEFLGEPSEPLSEETRNCHYELPVALRSCAEFLSFARDALGSPERI
jgi:hypothetical protein